MIILTLLHPQQQAPIEQWEFSDPAKIRIGRALDNDIVLEDALVSRYHVELHNLGETEAQAQWQLLSQGTNGTFVNNQLVSQGVLTNGSLIQLAPKGPMLRFELMLAPEAVAPAPSDSSSEATVAFPPSGCNHAGNPPDNLFCIHCGQPIRIQGIIHGYQLLRMLGQGGMGITYLVWSPQAKGPQLQVLKEIKADMAEVPKAKELFLREARILQSLDHPAIPRFFDCFVEQDKTYLAMELIHGQSLDQLVLQTGPIAPRKAIDWMLQTCEVLDYLHHLQPPVIHRDIKPSNLLRKLDGRVGVIDFGAVKEVGSLPGTRISIEGYSAPEQGLGHPQIQSDFYAVGATLIFLLTGKNPNKFYRDRGQGDRLQVPELPLAAPLRAVIAQATEPKPGDRYATARDLAAALKSCLQ